ncbi:MAG: holo-ACP synthase, partial [Acidimicrobiales bacterium]
MTLDLPIGALTGSVIGIGNDLVDLDRFRVVLDRTPTIVQRVFTEAEQQYALQRNDPTERFGGRFAAKEATMKALGVGLGAVRFRDIEVVRHDDGAPELRLHGAAHALAVERGVERWLISLSHTGHLAQAF